MRKALLLFLCCIFVVSCAQKETENVLSVAISSEPPTLDTMVNTSLISRIVSVGNIYERLLVLDGDGKIRTELSDSYSLSPDGKHLEFKLREGVLFHDGKEMRAEDVVASLNRWIEVYGNAKNFVGENRFYALDDHTVAIDSESSLVLFPFLLASAPQSAIIVPSSVIKSLKKGELMTSSIGTGPYKLSSWNSGEKITLERFDGYKSYSDTSNGIWGEKKANIETLEYYFVSDSTTRRLGLQRGQYDFMNDLMSEDRSAFMNNDKYSVIEGGESGSIALVFNKKEGIGQDINFRKAVSLALDPDSLMKACYGNYGYNVHPDYMEKEQTIWNTEDVNPYQGQDIEKAKEYLEKVADVGKIRILTSNLSNLDKIALKMSESLERVGIKTEIISTDWASMIEKRKTADAWDIYISAFSRVSIPQMKSYLSSTFPGWIDPECDGMVLLDKMNDAMSLEDAVSIWKDAQSAFYEYVPAIIPGHYITSYVSKSEVKGIINQDGFFFWNAEVSR